MANLRQYIPTFVDATPWKKTFKDKIEFLADQEVQRVVSIYKDEFVEFVEEQVVFNSNEDHYKILMRLLDGSFRVYAFSDASLGFPKAQFPIRKPDSITPYAPDGSAFAKSTEKVVSEMVNKFIKLLNSTKN